MNDWEANFISPVWDASYSPTDPNASTSWANAASCTSTTAGRVKPSCRR
jgi:hypothetical protein